jgi:hypothetical protein
MSIPTPPQGVSAGAFLGAYSTTIYGPISETVAYPTANVTVGSVRVITVSSSSVILPASTISDVDGTTEFTSVGVSLGPYRQYTCTCTLARPNGGNLITITGNFVSPTVTVEDFASP